MPFTVEHALKKLAPFCGKAGTCWDAPENLIELNDARELIYEQGDYEGTMEWGCVNICGGKFFLPPSMQTVRDAYWCHRDVKVNLAGHTTLDQQGAASCCVSERFPMGNAFSIQPTGQRKPYTVQLTGKFNFKVVWDESDDDEVKLTFQVIREGQRLTEILESAELSSAPVDDIVSVVKPVTVGFGVLWGSCDGQDERFMAEYAPWQENPLFTEYQPLGGCGSHRQVVLFGKKMFYELRDMDQLVDIESISALKSAYQAINEQQADDDAKYVGKLQIMVNRLSLADKNLSVGSSSADLHMNYSNSLGPAYD